MYPTPASAQPRSCATASVKSTSGSCSSTSCNCRRCGWGAHLRSWRRQHGPAMMGTLLDAAEHEGRDRPTFGERIDLAVHAGLARLSIIMPARVRQGVAAVALATGTGFAVAYLLFAGWAPFLRDREFFHAMFSFVPFMNSGVVFCAAWIVVFGFALLGWRRAASVTLVATIVIAGVTIVAPHTGQE